MRDYMDNYYNQNKSDKKWEVSDNQIWICGSLIHVHWKTYTFVNPLIIGLLVTIRFKLQLQRVAIFLLTKPIIIVLHFDEVLLFKQLCTKYYMPHVWHFLLWWKISSVALNKIYALTQTLYINSLIKLECNAREVSWTRSYIHIIFLSDNLVCTIHMFPKFQNRGNHVKTFYSSS